MSKQEDMRDASLEAPLTLPNTWYHGDAIDLSSTGMFLSGLIMITRNRFLAWPSLLFSILMYANQHPRRMSKEGGGANALSNMSLCIMALVASHIPLFMLPPQKKVAEVPIAT